MKKPTLTSYRFASSAAFLGKLNVVHPRRVLCRLKERLILLLDKKLMLLCFSIRKGTSFFTSYGCLFIHILGSLTQPKQEAFCC